MLDVAFTGYALALLTLLGAPFAVLLPSRIAGRLALAPLMGYGVIAVVAPILFSRDVAVRTQVAVFVGAAVLGAGLLTRHLRRRSAVPAGRGPALVVVGAWALTVLIASLPKWIAGAQYYVYLGNIWDQFNYTTAGVLVAKSDPAFVNGFSFEDVEAYRRNPLLFVRQVLDLRPSVEFEFSVLGYPGLALRVPPFELAHAFVVLTLSLHVFAFAFAWRNLTRSLPVLTLGAVFACGFWGQYLVDVNAWSQLAGLMFVLPVFTLGVVRLDATPLTDRLRAAAVLAVCGAAVIYLYPEMLVVYGPAYVGALLYRVWRDRLPARLVMPQVAAGVLAIALALPEAPTTLSVPVRAVALMSRDVGMSTRWAAYFHGFVFGPGGLTALSRAEAGVGMTSLASVNAGMSGVGLYHFTWPLPASTGWAIAYAVAATAYLAALLSCAAYATRHRLPWLGAALLVGGVLIVGMSAQPNFYGAGKAYFWLSPLVFLTLTAPLWGAGRDPVARLPAAALLAAQLVVVVLRVHGAATHDGIPFGPPYPADQMPILKQTVDFTLTRVVGGAGGCRMVLVDIEDPFLRHYVMVTLFARDVPHLSRQELNTYYGAGSPKGYQFSRVPPDCAIRLRERAVGAAAQARRHFVLEPGG